MKPLKIIQKYYDKESTIYNILVEHSQAVTKKAIEIALNVPHLKPDLDFIQEAAMLHDIGMYLTYAPEIECFGDKPYICHGYLGRELLEKEGHPIHALVCERHVGVGLRIQDIEKNKFPIPKRDMKPISIEEKIICIADKFYSKKENQLSVEKNLNDIKTQIDKYGPDKLEQFNQLLAELNLQS